MTCLQHIDTSTILFALKVVPLFRTQGRKLRDFFAFVHTQFAPLNKMQGLRISSMTNYNSDFGRISLLYMYERFVVIK